VYPGSTGGITTDGKGIYGNGLGKVGREVTTFGELVATFKFDAGLRGLFLPQFRR